MRSLRSLLAPLLILIVITGCSTTTFDQGADLAQRPAVDRVSTGHDAYVGGDTTLSTDTKTAFLAQSYVFREAWNYETGDIPKIADAANAVVDRYEDYVLVDPKLSSAMKKALLFQATAIKEMIAAGSGQPDAATKDASASRPVTP